MIDNVIIFGFTTLLVFSVLLMLSNIGPMTGFLALFSFILFLLFPMVLVYYIVWVVRFKKFGLKYSYYLLDSLVVFLASLGVLWLASGGCGGILDVCGLITGIVVVPSFLVLASFLVAPLWWRIKGFFKK